MTVTRGDSRVLLRVYAAGEWPHVTEIELDEFRTVMLVELLRDGDHGTEVVADRD